MDGYDLSVDELLMAHAAGRLPEPVALLVATHLALSPTARARYRRYEAVGGALLGSLEPSPLDPGAWDRLSARLGDGRRAEERPSPRSPLPPRPWPSGLPKPLRDYLPAPLEALRWRSYGAAAEVEVPVQSAGYRTTLVRVRAGKAVPRHTHGGKELTLVLEGAYRDGTARYARGDLAVADSSVDHRPTAEAGQDCLCLAVTDAPVRLTGPFGRVLNPFVRF
jgi:putative transcriptional regulator